MPTKEYSLTLISRRPTCDIVPVSNRHHFSAICSSGYPTHLRWIADVLKLLRNANRIGAISNHSICKYGYYGSDGASHVNTANEITYNLVVLPDHLFQNQSFLYILGEVCLDVVVSLLSGRNISLQCIRECLLSIFLYSLVFIFMTGVCPI